MTANMPDDKSAEETDKKKPFQFGMKDLLALPIVVAVFCTIATGLGAYSWLPVVFTGFVLYAVVSIRSGRGFRPARLTIHVAAVFLLYAFMHEGVVDPYWWARLSQCRNGLKQIGLALHNYHDTFGCFPPAYTLDDNGRRMHSWRVLILPYIDEKDVYDQYCLDEPWDGPNNSRLATALLNPSYTADSPFSCPEEDAASLCTSYVAVVGPGCIWQGSDSIRFEDIAEGTSNTLIVVEVHNSGIHWMEPRDLELEDLAFGVNHYSGRGISSLHPRTSGIDRPPPGGAVILMADGSASFLGNDTSPEVLNALARIGDGKQIACPRGFTGHARIVNDQDK